MATNISALARRFVEATVNKLGTDEEAVFEILKTVHDQKIQAQFEADVYELSRQPVNLILNDELDGSQLARAEDLLKLGRETYRSSRLDYFFDWSGKRNITKISSSRRS